MSSEIVMVVSALVALAVALWIAARAILRGATVERVPALLAIFAIAALLRMFRLGAPSYWLDELGTWWILDATSVSDLADRLFSVVPNAGVYYWGMFVVAKLGGRSELVLRAPSVVCGMLSIGLIAWCAHRVAPTRPRVAYLAALLLSVTYLHSVLSQDARPYAWVYLLAVVATYFWLRLEDEKFEAPIALGFALASAALIREQWLSGLYVAGLCGTLLWRARSWPRVLATFVVLGVLLVPSLGKLQHDLRMMPHLDWMRSLSSQQRLQTALESLFDPIPVVMLVVSLCLVRARAQPIARLLGVMAIVLGLATLAFVLAGKMFFVARYLFPLSIPALLVAASQLDRLAETRPRLVRALVLIVVAGSLAGLQARALVEYGTFKYYSVADHWRDAITALDADRRATDLVLFRSGFIEQDFVAENAPLAGRCREFADSILDAGPYAATAFDERVALTKTWDEARFADHLAVVDRAVTSALAAGQRVVVFGRNADLSSGNYFARLVARLQARTPLHLAQRSVFGDVERWVLASDD